MINQIVGTAVIWTIGYLLYIGVLRQLTFHRWNRVYLLLIIGGGALFPWIPYDSGIGAYITLPNITIGSDAVGVVDSTTVNSMISWSWVGQIIYTIGVIFVLYKLGKHLISIYKLVKQGQVVDKSPFKLIINEEVEMPFSFFNYIFVSEKHRVDSVIWQHETAHSKSWHSIDNLVTQLIFAGYWFNPILYLLLQELKHIHEYEADAKVLMHQHRKTYSYILLKHACPSVELPLASPFNSQIKKRIKMMFKKKSSLQSIVLYPLSMVFMVFVVLLATSNTALAQISDDDTTYDKVDRMPYMYSNDCKGQADEELEKCAQRAMLQLLYENIKYPQDAKEKGSQGMVVVQFVVSKRGWVKDIKIVRSVSEDIDAEVVRIMEEVLSKQKWVPGMKDGKTVNVSYNLPVRFNLN